MRVTSKGQVTIPQEVRKRLGIEAGSEVDFVWHDGNVFVQVRHDDRSADDLVASMQNAARGKLLMSTDELMKLTRGDDWLD